MKCEAYDCDRAPIAFGLCDKHYRRFRKHGDPDQRCSSSAVLRRQPGLVFLLEHLNVETELCIHWPFKKSHNGYGVFKISGRSIGAHRKMCELAHGRPPDPRYDAAHSCHQRSCVNPRHLAWKSKKDNQADRVADGTMIFGRKNPANKLSEREVIEIRRMALSMSHEAIAGLFGINRGTVSKIARGERWGWLKSIEPEAKNWRQG